MTDENEGPFGVTELRQIIGCPNCTQGWVRVAQVWKECPVCETRAFLVIDSAATMQQPMLAKPTSVKRTGD